MKPPFSSKVLRKALLLSFLCALAAGLRPLYGAAIYAYPLPWIPEDGHTQTGNLYDGIRFRNIPFDSLGEVDIYTMNGMLVRRLSFDHPAADPQWDGKNSGGEDVASGMYFWIVKTADQTKSGRLIVIR